jgi:hypothetical protein
VDAGHRNILLAVSSPGCVVHVSSDVFRYPGYSHWDLESQLTELWCKRCIEVVVRRKFEKSRRDCHREFFHRLCARVS